MAQSARALQPAGFRLDIGSALRSFGIILLRTLDTGLLLLRNPTEGFWQIKQGVHPVSIIVLLALTFLTRVISLQITSFHYATIDPEETNLFLVAFSLFLPWASWVVAHYGVAAIWYGEGSFRDVLSAAAYCLFPYILVGVPLAIMSNVWSLEEKALYRGVEGIMIWATAFLFLWSVRTLHDFDMKQTLVVTFLSIAGMVILWATLALIYVLTNQIVTFFREFTYEIFTH